MTHHRLHALALACLLAMPASAFAAGVAPPTGISAGVCVEGICEYRLRNGLRVLLFPDAWSTSCSRARRSMRTSPAN